MIRHCIIIEDQPPAQRILQRFIKDVGFLNLKGTFSNAIEARAFLQKETIDLIFLDIHLPKISGMDFLKTLKNSPQIILTTAFSDYALESYEYNVADYLLKPFSFKRFVQAIDKSLSLVKTEKQEAEQNNKTIFIKSGYDLIKVESEDILYITSDADYTEIITETKKHLSSYALKHWLQKLDNSFFQIHKSYIINTSFLVKISSSKVYLKNDVSLPIGRAFKADFIAKFSKF